MRRLWVLSPGMIAGPPEPPCFSKAAVSTRIRLADSQQVVAIARLGDGSFWSDSADVIVTLAACAEG